MKTRDRIYPGKNLGIKNTPWQEGCHASSFGKDLPVAFYRLENGIIVHANGRFAALLDYQHLNEVLQRPFSEIVHPDDRQRFVLEDLMPDGPESIPDNVFRLTGAAGKIVWVRAVGNVRKVMGQSLHAGCLIDITTFMEMEKSYRALLRRYKEIFDQVEDGLSESDLKGNITFVNRGAARIWAGQAEKGIGLNYRSYVDEQTAKEVFQAYHRVFKTGISAKCVYEITRKDGVRRFVEDSISLIKTSDGKKSGFRVVTRDVQAWKEAEIRLACQRRRLEAIFDSVSDAIITVDQQFKVVEANKSITRICGVSHANITGRKLTHGLTRCRQVCVELLNQTLQKRTSVKECPIECGHRLRQDQVVSVSCSPLGGGDRFHQGAVMVIRDMTRLQNLEKKLRERKQFHNIIGKSKTMQSIYELIEKLAVLDSTVLVCGESGTGKELVARALHYAGERLNKPFVTVNCSALSENLLESELFGHVRGAFTDAVKDKQGRFELASGGTILLDEIGEISPLIQLKLLRVLQEKEYEKVGESVPIKANVRVVACTNRNLKKLVQKGLFRQDLYYRLKVLEISLPPLRDRLEDLPLLVDHFRKRFNEHFKKNIDGITRDVQNSFMAYRWPGNVRELEHAMEHAFVLCHHGIITLEHLPAEIRDHAAGSHPDQPQRHQDKTADQQMIMEALNYSRWNKTKAARLLGISRRTLYRKLHQHNLIDRK